MQFNYNFQQKYLEHNPKASPFFAKMRAKMRHFELNRTLQVSSQKTALQDTLCAHLCVKRFGAYACFFSLQYKISRDKSAGNQLNIAKHIGIRLQRILLGLYFYSCARLAEKMISIVCVSKLFSLKRYFQFDSLHQQKKRVTE